MVATTLPAVVRVVDLPVGTTVTGAELIEAVQTSAGVGVSVQLPLSQIFTSIGGVPTGGATGTILNKSSGSNYSTQFSAINTFVNVGTSLTTSGSATSIVAFVANQGITSTQIANNAVGTNQVASSLGIASALSIGGLLTVGGTATITGTTILNGGLQVTGTSLLAGTFGVVGTSQLTGVFNVVGTSTFTSGAFNISGAVNVVGTTFITGVLNQVGTSLMTGLFGVSGTSNFTGVHNVVGTTLFTSGNFGVVGTSLFTGVFGQVGTSLMTGQFGVNGTALFTSVAFGVIGTTLFTSGAFGVVGTTLFTSGSFGVVGTTLFTSGSFGVAGTTLFTSGAFGVVGTALFTSGSFGVVGTATFTGSFILGSQTSGVLVSSGTGVVSAQGGAVLLNTLLPNNVASTNDTSSFTAAYRSYLITFENVCPATQTTVFEMQVATSGSSFIAASYISLAQVNSSGTFQLDTSTTALLLSGIRATTSVQTTLSYGCSGEIRLLNPASTVSRKQMVGLISYLASNGAAGTSSMAAATVNGWYDGAVSPVTGVNFLFSAGNIQTGTIKIYGFT